MRLPSLEFRSADLLCIFLLMMTLSMAQSLQCRVPAVFCKLVVVPFQSISTLILLRHHVRTSAVEFIFMQWLAVEVDRVRE